MVTLTSRVFESAEKIGALWCSFLHDSPTWPIHGHYRCRVCGRQYQVAWAELKSAMAVQVNRARVPSLQSA